jgi:hypothetical protein
MDRYQFDHAWDLIEQARPRPARPFGFICCCGAGAVASFASARAAIRAARSHLRESAGAQVRAA